MLPTTGPAVVPAAAVAAVLAPGRPVTTAETAIRPAAAAVRGAVTTAGATVVSTTGLVITGATALTASAEVPSRAVTAAKAAVRPAAAVGGAVTAPEATV